MSSIAMKYEEILAVGDLDLFLAKTRELCEKKIHNKFFNGMEKDDVVQEVLIKVYQSIDSFDSSKAKADTFFECVINNKIKDCLRYVSTESNKAITNAKELICDIETTDLETQTDYEVQSVLGKEDAGYACAEYMMDFMENIGLDDREKKIFKLRCSGYDFVEIANMLGLTKARISQLWKGIIKKYEGA